MRLQPVHLVGLVLTLAVISAARSKLFRCVATAGCRDFAWEDALLIVNPSLHARAAICARSWATAR